MQMLVMLRHGRSYAPFPSPMSLITTLVRYPYASYLFKEKTPQNAYVDSHLSL